MTRTKKALSYDEVEGVTMVIGVGGGFLSGAIAFYLCLFISGDAQEAFGLFFLFSIIGGLIAYFLSAVLIELLYEVR